MDVLWIRLPAPDVEQERVNDDLRFDYLLSLFDSEKFNGLMTFGVDLDLSLTIGQDKTVLDIKGWNLFALLRPVGICDFATLLH